jgi:hypothetical protein
LFPKFWTLHEPTHELGSSIFTADRSSHFGHADTCGANRGDHSMNGQDVIPAPISCRLRLGTDLIAAEIDRDHGTLFDGQLAGVYLKLF